MKTATLIFLISLLASFNLYASYSYSAYDVKSLIIEQAKEQKLSPALALAVAKVESDFNASAVSSAGARGVMQIMPKTAEQVFGVDRDALFEAETNIHLGIKFLKQLLQRYDQRLDIALSHYNGGSAVKRQDGSYQVIPHTQNYVNKVLKYYRKFTVRESYSPFKQERLVSQASYDYIVGEPLKAEPTVQKVAYQRSESIAQKENIKSNINPLYRNPIISEKRTVTANLAIRGPKMKVDMTPSNNMEKGIDEMSTESSTETSTEISTEISTETSNESITAATQVYTNKHRFEGVENNPQITRVTPVNKYDENRWVDTYSVFEHKSIKKEIPDSDYHLEASQNEKAYAANNRQAKVRQWESIFN